MGSSGVEALEARRLFAAFAPDVSFGEDAGIVGPPRDMRLRAVPQQYFLAVDADGILAFQYSEDFDASLQRYQLDGTIDPSFTPITLDKTTSPLYGSLPAAYDAQGRVLAVDRSSEGAFRIARYLRTGALDTSFGAQGYTTITLPRRQNESADAPTIDTVRAAPDGGVYVSATLHTYVPGDDRSAREERWLVHLRPNGVFDTDFGDDGFVDVGGGEASIRHGNETPTYPQRPYFVEVDPQGRAVVGTRVDEQHHTVTRYTLTGDLDTTFAAGGVYEGTSAVGNEGFQMILDSAGRPIIAISGRELSLRRLTTSGVSDSGFGTGGVVSGLATGSRIPFDALVALPGGKLLLQIGEGASTPLVRLNANGSLDKTFDGDGKAAILGTPRGELHVQAALSDGSLLSNLTYIDSIHTIARLDTPQPVERSRTGVLYIRGTDASDSVTVTPQDVIFNGETFSGIVPGASSIDANLLGGNNSFNAAAMQIPTTVLTGSGNDILFTGSGADRVESGAGADTIKTGSGRDDTLFGTGDKDIDSGFGGGYLWTIGVDADDPVSDVRIRGTGVRGNDRWDVSLSQVRVDLALGGSNDVNVLVGGEADNLIDLSEVTGRVKVTTFSGDDSILTGSGDDVVFASTGNDTIRTGAGNDLVGSDIEAPPYPTQPGGRMDDLIDLGAGHDIVADGFGDNTITGGAGNDSIRTGSGNDSVFGGLGRDTIRGGAGNDTLDGGAHHDRIFGNAGNDSIIGGSGNDVLVGDAGTDTLIGNKGNDLFVTRDSAIDLIRGGDGSDRGFVDDDDDVGNVESILNELA